MGKVTITTERVTMWREEDGKVGIVKWANPNLGSKDELTPKNATIVVYTDFCKETVNIILKGSKKDRDEFVNDYLP